MEFFTSPTVTLGTKLLEVFYIVMGGMSIYAGIKNFRDQTNPARLGTGLFWCLFGVVLAFGRWIFPAVNGVLIVVMMLIAILGRVKKGSATDEPAEQEVAHNYQSIGMKIFIPALCIGVFAVAGACIPAIGALAGCCIGVMVAACLLLSFSRATKPTTLLNDSERLLSQMGALSLLPMLLASLGALFTTAGVGDTISNFLGGIIPAHNLVLGIVVFAVGMALFTAIMGNAFAAITFMTAGVGVPFVLSLGANPAIVGIIALTCGYCGTLITPMAANFNIVPVALLEMKDRMGVIKYQVFTAGVMLVVQIIYMLIFA